METDTRRWNNVWLDMDREIQEQLALQVALSLSRHYMFLVAHGLSECRCVVDIGTGSGLFLSEIASRNPLIRFHGVDNQPHMIHAARARRLPNLQWLRADALDSRTSRLLSTAEGILMRYFVLHLPDTKVALKKILASAPAGARLWVLDLDTDHCRCEPPNAVFDAFVHLVREFCDRSAVEIRTGTVLPPILDACGLEVEDVVVEPFNNREIDTRRFAEYLMREASLYHHILRGTPGIEELRPLRELLDRQVNDGSPLLQYGMVMLSAVKRPF